MAHTSVPYKRNVWITAITGYGSCVVELALMFAFLLGTSHLVFGQDELSPSGSNLPGLSASPSGSPDSIKHSEPINFSNPESESGEPSKTTGDSDVSELARQERLANLQRFNDKTIPWLNIIFVWIGFIFSTGLLAKGIVAFTDEKAGLWTVMIAGTVGTIANIGIQMYLFSDKEIRPISVSGFILAFLVAFFFMLTYVKCIRIKKTNK